MQQAAARLRNSSRRSLQSFGGRPFSERPCMTGRIAEIGTEPNSTMAHGRYLETKLRGPAAQFSRAGRLAGSGTVTTDNGGPRQDRGATGRGGAGHAGDRAS